MNFNTAAAVSYDNDENGHSANQPTTNPPILLAHNFQIGGVNSNTTACSCCTSFSPLTLTYIPLLVVMS